MSLNNSNPSTSQATPAPGRIALAVDDMRFKSASMVSCGVAGCKEPYKVYEAVSKMVGINGIATAAFGLGGIVAAAYAVIGAGPDPTSTAIGAMAAASVSTMSGVKGGLKKPKKDNGRS